ncbi:PINIT domain-containing protein [Cubamyces lactineus]|nr:PINIT domain-containing protein [Cubamyces lactineus]
MANQDAWADFDTLRHNLKSNKVEQLKQILTGFNDECHTNLTKTGKKQDLIDKITRELDNWRRSDSVDYWLRAKAIMQRVRQTGYYVPRQNGEPSYSSTHTHNYAPPPPPPTVAYQPGSSSSNTIPRYDPYAPPRRPAVPAPPANPAVPAAPSAPAIRFKYSPFFRIERLVSPIAECLESANSMDRRSQSLSFTLSEETIAKLASPSPKYQLRLYCTSSTFYSPPGAFRSPVVAPCPIEFPPTCEVRVNGMQLTANMKGLKKKPGTAPPPDLGKSVKTAYNQTNRIEMIYVNSQQPTTPKKYYLAVMLVEVTTVDQLIDRLRKGKYKPKAEILAGMRKSVTEDDEIVAGAQKMSLKCPLSYMRITTPCRSSTCVHPQCFDAMSWFSVMEQTTTWMCPVCEKVLNVEDLIIDGYFDDILKSTPESVEDVIVEADGQWHTEDNKFGSAEWVATHPTPTKPASPLKRAPSPVKPVVNSINGRDKPRPSNAEIVILDSDEEDEDEGRVKRELSPSAESARFPRSSQSISIGGSQPPRSQATDIIDLTLDSEDDEPPPPRPTVPLTKKRKEMDELPSPTEQIWKKSRTDSVASSSAGHERLSMRGLELVAPPLATHPSSSQSRYTASQHSPGRSSGSHSSQSYAGSGTLPPPPSLPRRPPVPSHENYRNSLPLPTSYAPRGSGAGASSPQSWR